MSRLIISSAVKILTLSPMNLDNNSMPQHSTFSQVSKHSDKIYKIQGNK